jgi:hypothetical protein
MHSWGALAGFDQPFIGLRPFKYSDRRYFFGRYDKLDVLELHQTEPFRSLVGRAACGKSSLILRPRLERVADHRWRLD